MHLHANAPNLSSPLSTSLPPMAEKGKHTQMSLAAFNHDLHLPHP
jgi:hypothetical protein